uniref:NADH-ubiquinone oxidoreductase chain 2 n=1 Tax=Scolytinae sp. BMNH 1039990 TaxID=1903772 RepID=A0A343A4M2_9CUCU|nr:NADH dehydrogenase subunit 2 [Scolytinae sp. BMNH 1039990]
MLFSSTLMISAIMAISSLSWFSAWMSLEINLLSMIPLMTNTKNKMSSEASIKYFIIQATASMILLFSIMIMPLKLNYNQMEIISSLALTMKMGAAPLHFWLPEVISGINWNLTLIMLTWQKIAPMLLLINLTTQIKLLMMIIVTSSILGSVGGMNQTCMRKILAYSSINHIGWMLAASMFSTQLWLTYFLIYSIINMALILPLKKMKMFFLPQLTKISPFHKMYKLLLMMNLMSLGGLPPFLGFFPKWLTINVLEKEKLIFLAVVLILATLISLFVYLRAMFPSMTMINQESIKLSSSKLSNLMIALNILSVSSLNLMMLVP